MSTEGKKKMGRPLANPERGPMTNAEKQRARRERLQSEYGNHIELWITSTQKARLYKIAKRRGISTHEVINELIRKTPLPRK